MKSWEVYNAARQLLKNKMYSVYGNRNSRMIDYWAQDPKFCADPKRNPIDRLEQLFRLLDESGNRDIAKSALRILASVINCRVSDQAEVCPDKETLFEEMVDDMPRLVEYQKALQGNDLEEVDHAKAHLERELAETRAKFIEVRGLK